MTAHIAVDPVNRVAVTRLVTAVTHGCSAFATLFWLPFPVIPQTHCTGYLTVCIPVRCSFVATLYGLQLVAVVYPVIRSPSRGAGWRYWIPVCVGCPRSGCVTVTVGLFIGTVAVTVWWQKDITGLPAGHVTAKNTLTIYTPFTFAVPCR